MDAEMILETFDKGLKKNLKTPVDMIDSKGGFSYLSWPYAVTELQKLWPEASFGIYQNGEAGVPYVRDSSGAYVTAWVMRWPGDEMFTFIHPVLDHKNKPILNPNAFEVNTSCMRALVKAIAIRTGLGLSLYVGEDIPGSITGEIKEASPEQLQRLADEVAKFRDTVTHMGANDMPSTLADQHWADNMVSNLVASPAESDVVEACEIFPILARVCVNAWGAGKSDVVCAYLDKNGYTMANVKALASKLGVR